MNDPTPRLRALGYHLDPEDRWVHPGLRLWLRDPERLLDLDPGQVEAFHDDGTWAELQPGERPPLEPTLLRAVRRHGLRWDGWVGAWLWPALGPIAPETVRRLGAEGLDRVANRLQAFHQELRARRTGSCMGVLAMFLWLALGWLAGTAVWLFGMAMIALGTWVMRPPRSPGDLWDEAPPVDLHPLFQAGRSMLGAGWEQVAELFGALPAAGGAVWFTRLERGAEVATLRSRFTPEGLLAILGCVAPLDDRLLVHAPGSR